MFTLAQPAYYPTYNPYEELLLQQELQRRRQIEAYFRRQREAEELERRRQYEYAILQAELERRRQAEYERRRAEVRRRQEVELQRRREAECHSMFDAGVQDLFDMIYGARPRSRSMSSRATPTREQSEDSQRNAVSIDEKPSTQTRSTPGPVPAPEPSLPTAEADQEPGDETPQIDTAPSLAAVQSILASFATLRSEFVFPTRLDLLPSSPKSSPKLAYTPNNAPLHGYEHALTGLLTQLDAVESFGDDEVRRTRKEAVKTVEKELEKLDERKAEMWKKQFEPEVSASQDVGSVSAELEAEVAAEIDPHAVPLPRDSGVEDEDVEMGEAVPEVSPSSERADTTTSHSPPESPLPTLEAFSTPAQSPLVEDLPHLPNSSLTVASIIAHEPPILTPIITSASDVEPLSQSFHAPPLESGDTDPDTGLEEYVDVALISAAEGVGENDEAELEEVEKDEDLELVRDWNLDF